MKPERGNALFIILIAVALFAALSYAITQSSRGGMGIEREKAELQAAALLQHAEMTRMAIQRMILRGIPMAHISQESTHRLFADGTPALYANPDCTSAKCKIYAPEGGNIPYTVFDQTVYDSGSGMGAGMTYIQISSIEEVGTSLPEAILHAKISKEVCDAINRQSGIVSLAGDFSYTAVGGYTSNVADKLATVAADIVGDDSGEAHYRGQRVFCQKGSSGDIYHLWYILIEQ